MSQNNEPDFMFSLNIPVNTPTQEEIDLITPHLELYLSTLVEQGHMSNEEAVAFVKFSSELGSYVPFMMDAFLQSYRRNITKKSAVDEVRENAEMAKTRIIT